MNNRPTTFNHFNQPKRRSVTHKEAIKDYRESSSQQNVDNWWLSDSSSEDEEENEEDYFFDQQNGLQKWDATVNGGKRQVKESRLFAHTTADPLFDPNQDDRQQKWVDKRIRETAGAKRSSDAYLSCPCCLCLVCLDSQRHEIYKTQYRAMFVQNCSVDTSQPTTYDDDDEDSDVDDITPTDAQQNQPAQQSSEQQQQQQATTNSDNMVVEERQQQQSTTERKKKVYYPVNCKGCDTHIAMYEADTGVYHFFDVCPSTA